MVAQRPLNERVTQDAGPGRTESTSEGDLEYRRAPVPDPKPKRNRPMKLKVNDLLGEKEGGIRPAITFTMRRCPESQPQPDGQVLSQRLVRIRKTYIARVLCTRLAVHVCWCVMHAARCAFYLLCCCIAILDTTPWGMGKWMLDQRLTFVVLVWLE